MTEQRLAGFEALGGVLTYPKSDFFNRLNLCRELMQSLCPESARLVGVFSEQVANFGMAEIEELYVRTFDLNPATTLDLGWHLFGEEYHRGLFLVKLNNLMSGYQVEKSSELPDHITHVMAILGRMDEESAVDFATACIIPSLRKMFEAIDSANPYHSLVEAVLQLLDSQYGAALEEMTHG